MAKSPTQIERERAAAAKAASDAKTKQIEADTAARRAEAEASAARAKAQSDAAQAQATAQARAAEIAAETRRQELAAEQAREQRAADERRAATEQAEKQRQEKLAHDNDPLEKGWKLATSAGGAVAGYFVGQKLAAKIETRQVATAAAAAKQIPVLAKETKSAVATVAKGGAGAQIALDRLAGIVKTADKLKLTSVKGPMGLATAGVLLVEGGLSRFVLAPGTDNAYARDALAAVGTGSLFAATKLVGDRMVQNATPAPIQASKSHAAIETARNVVARVRPESVAAKGPVQAVKAVIMALPKSRAAAVAAVATGATASLAALLGSTGAKASPALDTARAAAGRTAEAMGETTVLGASASPLPSSDGLTDAYTRVQDGRTVRVHAYRTPK